MDWDDPSPTLQPPLLVGELASAEPPQQRLTVQFLFAWITGSSILLGLYMAGPGQPKPDQLPMLIGLGIIRFIASVLYGAALGSWWLLAMACYQRAFNYPRWPGHWVCLIVSLKEVVTLVAGSLMLAVSQVMGAADDWILPLMFLGVPAFGAAASTVGWIVYLIGPRQPVRWKIYAGLRVAADGLGVLGAASSFIYLLDNLDTVGGLIFLYPMLAFTSFACGLAAFIAAMVALIIDLASGEPRDWLHWLGATIALVAPLLGTLLLYGAMTSHTMQEMRSW